MFDVFGNRMNKLERRQKWPPQMLILASAVSAAQFFGLWYIYLVMTPEKQTVLDYLELYATPNQ